ncbi:hypothetical protein SAMN04487995_1611 [Dyadobacter koreensis]|uniref:Lipoprotein n=1 Tax=Dyadobacter koreensis TaxID=408657 RepID=A0A1H6RXM7_9BACT|nr:hypothetical protein [Dyadobacter koreensis]SEI60513.1 hypothetical protein SAMN04487995_1611 [Dyadobacter koreensis]
MKWKIYLFFVSSIALASCVDIPDFDNTPKIYYNSIDQSTLTDSSGRKIQENVIVSIDFEDGDGDLGASDAERSDSVKYRDWGNYELVTSRLEGGKWVDRILALDRFKFFPMLKPDGKSGPIKGKLDLNTTFFYSGSATPVWVKFKVRIRDRALRVSNQVPTDSILVPAF